MRTLVDGKLDNGAFLRIDFSQAAGELPRWDAYLALGNHRISVLGQEDVGALADAMVREIQGARAEKDFDFSERHEAIFRTLCSAADMGRTFGLPQPENDNFVG